MLSKRDTRLANNGTHRIQELRAFDEFVLCKENLRGVQSAWRERARLNK